MNNKYTSNYIIRLSKANKILLNVALLFTWTNSEHG